VGVVGTEDKVNPTAFQNPALYPATLLPLLPFDLLLEPGVTCPKTPCSRRERPAVQPAAPPARTTPETLPQTSPSPASLPLALRLVARREPHRVDPADVDVELPRPQPRRDLGDVPIVEDRAVASLAKLLPERCEPRVHQCARRPSRGGRQSTAASSRVPSAAEPPTPPRPP